MTRTLTVAFAVVLAAASPAFAGPKGGPPRGDDGPPGEGGPSKEQREQMMKRMHTHFIVELGQELDLDTAGTLKLGDRLQKFQDQRVSLRLENFGAMKDLHQIAKGKATGDAAALARRIAQTRVKLAEVDAKELDEILTGLSQDKAAKAALFLGKFKKRMEEMGREMRQRRGGPGGEDGPGGRGGHGPPDGDD